MARRTRRRTKGSGRVYQRGSAWAIRWAEAGHVRYRGGFATRDKAERVLAEVTAEIQLGRPAAAPRVSTDVPPLSDLAKDWIERREFTHRSWRGDRQRWNKYLAPSFGHLRPAEVNGAAIRQFVERMLRSGLSSTTAGHCVRGLSTFFSDLVERELAPSNPVSALPRSTRRLYRNACDPRRTPFLERLEDVRRVFLALPETIREAFAIGAMAGLRTGEVLGLDWRDIDIAGRRLHIRQQVHDGKLGPLKDDDSRVVPIVKPLMPILVAYRVRTGGTGPLFPPKYATRGGRPGSPPAFLRPNTLWKHLRKALKHCKLPETLTWYHSTRHTFASQWVMGGGSIEKLSLIMGHASVTTTERYAHLRTDLFRESDYDLIKVDFSQPTGDVIAIGA